MERETGKVLPFSLKKKNGVKAYEERKKEEGIIRKDMAASFDAPAGSACIVCVYHSASFG